MPADIAAISRHIGQNRNRAMLPTAYMPTVATAAAGGAARSAGLTMQDRELTMRVHRSLAFLAVAFMLAQPAWAAPPSAGSASRAAPPARGGFAPEVTTPITPQFNDP